MNLKKTLKPALVATFMVLAPLGPFKAQAAHADTIGYDVNFSDLGTLAGNNDLNLDFTLLTNGTPDNSTTMTFSNFNYGTGSGSGVVDPLTDDPGHGSFNESTSHFTAGSSLSFHINATFTAQTQPDAFALAFFRDSGPYTEASSTPSSGSLQGDGFSYILINFDKATPNFGTFAGTNPTFIAPTITVTTVATPEPQTWAMIMLGLGVVVVALRRRKSEEEKSQREGLTPIPVANR